MWWTVVTACLVMGASAEDSLRPALHALQKRQRDMAPPPPPPIYYSRNNLIYGDGQPEDIGYGYQKAIPGTSGVFEAIAIPYSELGASYEPENAAALGRMLQFDTQDVQDKRSSIFRERDGYDDQDDSIPSYLVPSPFRERMTSEGSRTQGQQQQQQHGYPKNFLARSMENEISDEDYLSVLNSIWEKYKGEVDPEDMSEADVEELLNYLGNKEDKKRQYGNYNTGYDFFNSPLAWAKRSLRTDAPHHKRYQETLFDERYPYRGPQKRYPITKRSPSSISSNAVSHRHKKNTPEKQTDPKVAAELSNIFESEQKKDKKNVTHVSTTSTTTVVPNTTQSNGQKEQTIDVNALKPVEVKKKSIKWSDYFGIDRRKKSGDNRNVNNEWLLKKYLEAYGVGKNQEAINPEKPPSSRSDDVDNKMKAMEDLIVDQALKYTGAHQGSTDSNEIQEVKEKVIAQLAAAYSLEKMRRALGEFKASLAAQKAFAPSGSHASPIPKPAEPEYKAKRIMKGKPAEVQGKMDKKDSHEQTNEIDFGTLGEKDCPVLRGVEWRCKKIVSLTGDPSELFLPLCNLHNMCYLCGPVLRAAAPRECDTAFLEESEIMCRDDPGCLYLARKTLAVSRSLKPDPELVCDWRNNPCLAQFLALSTDKR